MRRFLDDRFGRIALWLGFLVVHALLVAQVWLAPLAPFNDVIVVYRDWMLRGIEQGVWVGIDVPFVYPPLALAPMLAATVLGLDVVAYGWAWLLIVTLLDAAALAVLTLRGEAAARRRGMIAAWWWIGFLLLLGPVGLARLEAITAPLAIIAVRLMLERPAVAGALLAIGAWIKIWPGALIAATVIALRTRAWVLLGALLVTVPLLALGLILGGGTELFGFLGGQTGRGLQVESLLAAPWLIGAAIGAPGAEIVWNAGLNTFEVDGPGAAALSDWSTPILLALAAALLVLGVLARRTAPLETLVLLSVALVAVLVVTNKVGSPQFTAWLAGPLVLVLLLAPRVEGVSRARAFVPAILALSIAGLTQLVYPTGYDRLLAAEPLLVAVLLVKHALWIVLAGWATVGLVRLAARR